MSTLEEFSFENFQRLDDFPTYTSIIRSFGKPIIPPLLTSQKRELYSQLRKLAILEKETSKNIKGVSKSCGENKDVNEISHINTHNSNVSSKFSSFKNSALSSSSSKNLNNYPPANEMLVSTCKMPCSGECSTVHYSVIVCPNETKDSSENTSIEPETVDSNSETFESYSENDCDCPACQTQFTDVPYENIHTEQTNVSEDEQEFILGETEFESLPTVIYNSKHPVSDTDTESIATYITQSTDLDKYMDYPTEFSSPDDLAIISQSQYSYLKSVSSRSEDASTETIINTENELSPSASTLTGLNENVDESNNAACSPTGLFEVANASNTNRTYSVDSYMLTSKTGEKKLYVRKSESEPPQSYSDIYQKSLISPESDTFNKNFKKEAELSQNFPHVILDTVENCSVDLLSNAESCPDSEFKPALEGKVRRNSYTLLQPSPALIEAHADCCCQNNPMDASPHSCSSQHQNTPINVAFKKEMVELVLPPMMDRDKLFPVLNYKEPLEDFQGYEKELGSKVVNSEVDSEEEKSNSMYQNLSKSEPNSNASRELKTNFQENSSCFEKDLSLTGTSQSFKNFTEKSPIPENDLEKNCNSEVLIKLFKELKESHQLRANQLMEEQNKQWLKLQEEFKDQERRLLEKLKSTGIVGSSENNSLGSSTISVADVKSNVQVSVNNLHINKSGSDSYSSDSSSETFPTVILNNIDKTLCSKEEPTVIPPIHCDLSKNCDGILENVTDETAYNSCNASQENEPNLTNTYQSNSVIDLQENVEQIVTNSLFNCSNQNVIDVKQPNSSVSFIKNDIKSFESNQNSVKEACFLLTTSTNTVLPSKRTNDQISEICTIEDVQPKDFSLNEEIRHMFLEPTDQLQQSEISEKVQVNQERELYNAKELGTLHTSNIENLKASVNNNVQSFLSNANIVSDSSNMNFLINDKFDENLKPALKTEDIPQTSLASDNPVKALKVSTSLTNLKRRVSRDVNDPEFLKQLKRIPAMVKGYLTRRLLKTEKIEGMLQTMQESAILLQNLTEESKRGNPVTERDEELRQKLLNQLLTTYEEFYDIFFTISLKERLDIIAQSRNYRLKKVRAAQQKNNSSVNSNYRQASNASSKCSLQKNISNTTSRSSIHLNTTRTSSVNSASSDVSKTSSMSDRPSSFPVEAEKYTPHHCIQRKKKSVIDCRTYTKEDFKECQARACSTSSSKLHNKTPTRIYQSSVGINMNRKIKSLVKPVQTKPWK